MGLLPDQYRADQKGTRNMRVCGFKCEAKAYLRAVLIAIVIGMAIVFAISRVT